MRKKKKRLLNGQLDECLYMGLELTSIRSLLDEELPRPSRLSPLELPLDLQLLVCWPREREDKLMHAGMVSASALCG
jgi:hypothetical protein